MAREAWPLLAGLGGIAAAVVGGGVLGLGLSTAATVALAVPFALAALFAAWFFRDPERRPPVDPLALVSPADGKILRVGPGAVSVFMNVFDVHVCRAPMGGRITSVEHVPGSFLAAYKDAAAEHNERAHIVVRRGAAELRFTLVAGLVARRIVCRVRPGQDLATGERVGLIRFGSRVDVALPAGAIPEVARGQRVQAGITVIARLPGNGR